MNIKHEWGEFEEVKAMGRVADFQQYVVRRYTPLLADKRDRDDFGRHLAYLVHLVYREAQQPLVKQLTDFITQCTAYGGRPLIIEKEKL